MAASLAAALTAQALNVGWAPVVSPGVEALIRSRINHVYQNYVRPECHAAANAPLIWGQAGIPTATLVGGGLVAAVDGTRFVVPVRSIDARPNPKYFGRKKKGVTWLNMINYQGVGTAGMVLSGTPRDSLYAIDLMYRRDGGAGQRRSAPIPARTRTWCSGCSSCWAWITGRSWRACPTSGCGASSVRPTTGRSTPRHGT